MKSLTATFTATLMALAMTLSLAGCRDEGVDGPVDMTCTDIATYTGSDGKGHLTFTFQQADDSPLITLTSQNPVNPGEAEDGTRMLITYIPPENKAYTSGGISLLSARSITQSTVGTEWYEQYNPWYKHPVYVYSLWRSGSYINAHIRLTYSAEPRLFCLVADPNTLGSAWPEVYLVHIMSDDTENHDRAYYASFDIEPLWSRPEVEGIRLHVANSNLDKQIFTFAKTR